MKNYLVLGSKALLLFSIIIAALPACNNEENELGSVVEILTPLSNSIIEDSFTVEVHALDDNGIRSVELYLNNILIGKAETVPYEFTVNITGYSSGTYTLKAVANSNSGQSSLKEITVTIAKPTIPKPLEFKASKGQFGNKIALSWNESPGATAYQVFKQNSNTLQFEELAIVNTNVFEDLNIETPLKQYFYKVRAYNSETQYGEFSDYDYGYSNGKPYDLIKAFGTEGTQLNQFGMNVHIAYNNNELFVADDYHYRVVKYDNDGNLIGLFQSYGGSVPIAPYFFGDSLLNTYNSTVSIESGASVLKTISTNLIGVRQVTVDDENNIYMAASNSNKVAKYDMEGNLILEMEGRFNGSWGVAFYNNNIVVSNYFSNKVQFFSKNGEFIKEWTLDNACLDLHVNGNFLYLACGSYVAKTDYDGLVIEKIYGDFTFASSVVVGSNGNLFISDPYQRRIYIYKKSN